MLVSLPIRFWRSLLPQDRELRIPRLSITEYNQLQRKEQDCPGSGTWSAHSGAAGQAQPARSSWTHSQGLPEQTLSGVRGTRGLFQIKPGGGKGSAFICSSCYNKVAQTGWLLNNRHLLGSESWELQTKAESLSEKSPLPGAWMAIFSPCAHMIGEVREVSECLLRALIPFVRASPS